MPHIVIWTRRATSDLMRAYLFLAEKDNFAAASAVKAIREKSFELANFPRLGRSAEEIGPKRRELIVPYGSSGYLLLYRLEGSHVYILAVRHQRESGYSL